MGSAAEVLDWGGARRPGQDDVPSVAGSPFVGAEFVIVAGHQPAARLLIRDRLEDRIKAEERVTREVHLGDHSLREFRAEEREVDVCGPPRVAVVLPRIRPRLDRGEPVDAVLVGQTAAAPVKLGGSIGGDGC